MNNLENIILLTEKHYNLKPGAVLQHSRLRRTSLARNVAMFLCRKHTNFSLHEIAKVFKRDHSSVVQACKRITNLIESDNEVFNDVSTLSKPLPVCKNGSLGCHRCEMLEYSYRGVF